jgi:hypothetical protein
MAVPQRKAHVVHATAPSDVVATVLSSSHFRMLTVIAAITITAWFTWTTLYTKCDMEDTSVLSKLTETTLFDNNPGENPTGFSIHWLECINTTNKYKTKIPFTPSTAFVKLEWTEKSDYRCIREDAKIGRDTTHIAIMVVLALVVTGFVLQMYGFYTVRNRNTKHVMLSAWFAAMQMIIMVMIIWALWYIQNYAYYTTADDEKRKLPHAVWWMWTVMILSGVGSGVYAVLYLAVWQRTWALVFGAKSDATVAQVEDTGYVIDNGNTNPKGTAPFKHRMVRTDTMIAQYRHEKLTMSALLAVVAIIAAMGVHMHEENPGVSKFEVVQGDRLLSIATGTTAGSQTTAVALVTSNCSLYTPFRMNVTLYDKVVSTRHHIKYHMDDHGNGIIAVLSFFAVFGAVEIVLSLLTWFQQTFKLTHAFDKTTGTYKPNTAVSEMPIFDMFFSVVPLATQMLGSLAVIIMVLTAGFGVVLYKYELRHWMLATAIFGTLSFLLHFYHFANYLAHKVHHPSPKPKDAKGSL